MASWHRHRRSVASRVEALRSPGSGIVGQGVRFALSGGIVAIVYPVTTTLLADVVGLPFQAALAIGYVAGLALHFTLQRVFVWDHGDGFALSLDRQLRRYLLVAAIEYGITAASTALLPSALGISTEIVYLVTVAAIVVTNFLLFRSAIFHAKPPSAAAPAAPAD
ncbi:MAG TPA: GtrA family protein [Solirubrobacteraceae bacterium]|nr:GtrA family protein [Solirubrobacteraceae bacterium]